MKLFKTGGISEAERRIEAQRDQILKDFAADPWVGYDSIEDALNDYKCSTQAEVLARLLNRENVFISGPAGSGKTTIIDKFIKIIDAESDGLFNIALTASTGIAATMLEGTTIHSWAGLGISTDPFDKNNVSSLMLSKHRNMKAADVLIIDEISMLPAYIFEKLDAAMRHFRRSNEPFGGVQLVLMGDFLQLPPVDKKIDGVNAGFVTSTDAWKELDIAYCYMDKTHRASDPKLQEILIRISNGQVSDKTKKIVNSRIGKEKDSSKTYTTLFTTNANVDKYNEKALAQNPNPPVTLKAKTWRSLEFSEKKLEQLVKKSGVVENLVIKKGATVILTSNIIYGNKMYANGSIGEVTDYNANNDGHIRIKFNNNDTVILNRKRISETVKTPYVVMGKTKYYDKEVAYVEQFPVKLGYAITVHKSQGQTLDAVVVDLTKCFAPGLGYVALSRVRSMDDLIIKGISDAAYKVDPRSLKISKMVKKLALKNRADFIENFADYEVVLTSSMFRKILWNTEDTASKRERERAATDPFG